MSELLNIIRGRKSVRTFDGRKLPEADLNELKNFAADITNPFDVPVRFDFLDAGEHGLSSPVLTGEKLYVAGIVRKMPCADVAFGYAFERFVLHAQAMGIGTTWIGGTMKRELFEKAAALGEGERMPIISPLGYPAGKKSVRETLMRKGVGTDSRMPAQALFFDGAFGTPLGGQQAQELAELIEMVRWAPSAVNKQPWRIILKDGQAHFYEKQDKGYVSDATGDLQKIDVGIALCHFVMGLEEMGKKPQVHVSDPGITVPEHVEYIASVRFDF